MVSQSSQKVQEWLEGVQPVGDDAVVPPMTDVAGVETSDVARVEPSVHVEKVVVEPDEKTESEALETTETAKTADTEAETETVAKTVAEEGREKLESVPVTVDERTVGEEARSVSADTETTSLAPGDSASEINSRVAAAAAPAPAPAPAPATPASRLAKLAARLPQLGAVLNSTPRLQKQSEVVSLDDSDEEAKPEQSDLDKFVQRFVRHSNAKPKKAEKKTVNIR